MALVTITIPAFAQVRSISSNLLKVGDATVKRIMPAPESDSTYADADFTEVHFKQMQTLLKSISSRTRPILTSTTWTTAVPCNISTESWTRWV